MPNYGYTLYSTVCVLIKNESFYKTAGDLKYFPAVSWYEVVEISVNILRECVQEYSGEQGQVIPRHIFY